MSKGEQRAPEPSPAASTVHDTDDATTIREKRQESIALSAAELQGKDWALEGLQVGSHSCAVLEAGRLWFENAVDLRS